MKPWQKTYWCIPPKQNSAFAYHMEDVLAVYTRPYDAQYPVVCMDEGVKVLQGQVFEPLPMTPTHPKREDYEYDQQASTAIFLAVEPLAGRRMVEVRQRRTKADWAWFLHDVLERGYPTAKKVILVLDNHYSCTCLKVRNVCIWHGAQETRAKPNAIAGA